ncbi:unnamed protein product [Cuscuta campestris]|uniref:Retrotransposon gag domain-containing protein n=1 Tax=Cuscuta campestris TaxID=132261 RepID=A0A484M6X6_9ASTE|nr:unnamed protein product [Cuscuta campestris]
MQNSDGKFYPSLFKPWYKINTRQNHLAQRWTWRRLDRVMIHLDLLAFFQDVELHHLAKANSDHKPIFLHYNLLLTKLPDLAEVKATVWDLDPDSASGPDGFNEKGAFQKGKSIDDHILLAQEAIHGLDRKLRSGLETTRVSVELNLENQVSISKVATSFDSELESETEVIVSPIQSHNNMATLSELAAPDLQTQPMSITYAVLEKPLKLNSGFLNMLPKFHGLPGEDPYRHVNEFLITCGAMEPEGVPQEKIRLRAFPFSVMDRAKDWLYYMPPGSFTTWPSLHRAFLEEFFLASRIGSIRKDICGIKQMGNESFSEYWKRFNKLCASCPQHQISEQLLIQYFYEGLSIMDRSMVDAASGCALVTKTPEEAKNLFNLISQNTQQFGLRMNEPKKETESLAALTDLIANLTKIMGQMNMKLMQERQTAQDTLLSNLQAQINNRLPAQPFPAPKENVSAVVLRNNKVLPEPSLGNVRRDQEIMEKELDSQNIQEPELVNNKSVVTPDTPRAAYKPQPPFPSKYQNQRKNSKEPDDEIFEMFKKVQVNIPLLNAIKNVLKYAKFLKEMCTNKRRLKGDERVNISENVSAIFQKKLPQKCQDPGVFSVPCKIGNLENTKALLDLGASINVMPRELFDQLGVGELKETGVVIQLADRSLTYPEGVVEDVLVQLWLVITNVEEIPTKKVGEKLVPKTEDEFDGEDIKKVENYTKAINMLYCAVNPDDYRKISCCTTAKEMWDKLEVTYDGTDQVREAKIDFLTQEYEMFRMKKGEKIDDMFDRLSKIINDLHALKKTYANKDLVRKILRSLTPEWRSKADAIYESIGVSNVTIDRLRDNPRLARKDICDDHADSLERIHVDDDEENTGIYTNTQPQTEEIPQEANQESGLWPFVSKSRQSFNPAYVRAFYSNLRRDGDTIRSSINLYDIEVDLATFARVAGLPTRGDDIATYGGDDLILNNEAVVIRELGITNLIRHSGAPTIHSAPLEKRLLLYILSWILRPRDGCHTCLFNEDLKAVHAITHGASINWVKYIMIQMADCASITNERSLPYAFLVMDLIGASDIHIVGLDTKMTKIWIIEDSTFRKKSGDRTGAGPSQAPAPDPAKASLQSIADTLNRLTVTVHGMGQYLERMDWTLQRQHHDMTAFFRGINYVPPPFDTTFLGQNYEGEDEEDNSYAPSSSPDEADFEDAVDGDAMDVEDDEEDDDAENEDADA